jgi:hypothetical protein
MKVGRCALGGLAVVLFIFLAVIAVSAQSPGEIAAALHVDVVEWAPAEPLAIGYVTNESYYRLTNVQLRVDATDAAGGRLDPTFGWVYGDVPGRGGRGRFRVDVPRNAATCTISVVFFNLVAPEGSQAP